MVNLLEVLLARDLRAKMKVLNKYHAILELGLDGKILETNKNFLDIFGYQSEEIRGKHHNILVEPALRNSPEYADLWLRLNRGEHFVSEVKRVKKDGSIIWIQASYDPIYDHNMRPVKILKLITDITDCKLLRFDFSGQIEAINKTQAVIHFKMDGTILDANDNFLRVMGYSLSEIQGKHHSIFIEPEERTSDKYRKFWETLSQGKHFMGEFKRFRKDGKPIYIDGIYNPIIDEKGKPIKVIKYARDVTESALKREAQQAAQKVIDNNIEEIVNAISKAAMQSSNVSQALAQTSANVQMVASGAEQLNASVGEIAQSMVKSRNGADNTYEHAVSADQAAERLTEATQSMGGIVELIKSIADQINLLALNATIESARAGEAGKGFAVVANEVKNLANQATRATDDIAKEIEKTQSVSSEVVQCLEAIRQSIETVREYVTTTSSAVEEQRIVAREMSSNMQTAANAVASINESMSEIARATLSAEESAKHVSEAAKQIST
ncbi:methyl-accepting chemotaxis protein [Candidatus Odyssella thessalonicensis]|uniref:methyl-accepting chemotaxis protein n=1 Tax=Candidatus Odyssella thessalonicensis TaxID=84647 RepID=UPI000225AF47|nr:PAS domain-containing methyl-accepting chemotaxis protein [Candidatus Odyssella thessalonicensis]